MMIRVPKQSQQWVGPLTAFGKMVGQTDTPIPPSSLKYALLPRGQEPEPTDWMPPAILPGGDGSVVGIQVNPVEDRMDQGVWLQIQDPPNVPVLQPDDIAWITRT